MLLDMQQARRCLARTRHGTPCQSPAMKNGRCRTLARDLRRLADDIAPAAGEMTNTQRGGRRIVSTAVRRINGRAVTVQRKRSAFAIFVGG